VFPDFGEWTPAPPLDDQRSVGRLFLQFLPRLWSVRAPETVLSEADALWDTCLLYPAGARWDEAPPDASSWGSSILQTKETLEQNVLQLLKP
jgi:hypothetical protein